MHWRQIHFLETKIRYLLWIAYVLVKHENARKYQGGVWIILTVTKSVVSYRSPRYNTACTKYLGTYVIQVKIYFHTQKKCRGQLFDLKHCIGFILSNEWTFLLLIDCHLSLRTRHLHYFVCTICIPRCRLPKLHLVEVNIKNKILDTKNVKTACGPICQNHFK